MTTTTWLVTTGIRAIMTAAVLLLLFGAPTWAGFLGLVVVMEAATAARSAETNDR